MTVPNIIRASVEDKGLDAVGIVDCNCPSVVSEIEKLIREGKLQEYPEGGLLCQNGLLVLLGAEIEISRGGHPFHVVIFLPSLSQIRDFCRFFSPYSNNLNASTPRVRASIELVLHEISGLGGFMVIAHAFTPYKGYYGSVAYRLFPCSSDVLVSGSLADIVSPTTKPAIAGVSPTENAPSHLDDLPLRKIKRHLAIELGLSADTQMAERIPELHGFSFLSSSDAHSTPKIAREFTALGLRSLSFDSIKSSLFGRSDECPVANIGMDPRLGKYYRSVCGKCGFVIGEDFSEIQSCPQCGAGRSRFIKGVKDRADEIAGIRGIPPYPKRPPYVYQIPLGFLPGVGRVTINRLIRAFGGEINVLHSAPWDDIREVAGNRVADMILASRTGNYTVQEGGGGRYGKVTFAS
jgi:PHP family Zn ribbon phosphoesterase